MGEEERVFFKVTGTHKIFLTGNYVIPVDDGSRGDDYDSEDEEDELELDEDELDGELDDEESDDLDDLDDPRVTELVSDEEEAPKLVKSQKKRAAAESDDEEVSLDALMAKSAKPATNGEKLSKKQLKKLKNNAGQAVAAKAEPDSPASKKVSFAKNLEQGPTGTTLTTEKKVNGTTVDKKTVTAPKEDKTKSGLGVTVVQGVKIDVKKVGSGPAAKKNSKISMRYIGKLADGKQFDGKCISVFREYDADNLQPTRKASPFPSPSVVVR